MTDRPPIRLGLSHLAWGVDLSNRERFTAFLDDAASLGVEGVLIFDVTASAWSSDVAALRDALAGRGLALVGTILRAGLDFSATRQLAAWTAEAGGEVMPITGRTGAIDDWEVSVRAIEHHGRIAAAHGVLGAFHHNTAAVAPTMALTERLLAETRPELLAGMLDVGHATKDFVDGSAEAFYQRNHARIRYLELKDYAPETDLCTEVGAGRCNWLAVASALTEHGYRGWATIEQNGLPPDPRAAAERSLVFARNLLRLG
jgi:sugar phosphate isomerase/epimerase